MNRSLYPSQITSRTQESWVILAHSPWNILRRPPQALPPEGETPELHQKRRWAFWLLRFNAKELPRWPSEAMVTDEELEAAAVASGGAQEAAAGARRAGVVRLRLGPLAISQPWLLGRPSVLAVVWEPCRPG